MRRRHDNWINATHILKAAGFDKPARTRILERDVQKDVHEKIQGGYGKYQGTCCRSSGCRFMALRLMWAQEPGYPSSLANRLRNVTVFTTDYGSFSNSHPGTKVLRQRLDMRRNQRHLEPNSRLLPSGVLVVSRGTMPLLLVERNAPYSRKFPT